MLSALFIAMKGHMAQSFHPHDVQAHKAASIAARYAFHGGDGFLDAFDMCMCPILTADDTGACEQAIFRAINKTSLTAKDCARTEERKIPFELYTQGKDIYVWMTSIQQEVFPEGVSRRLSNPHSKLAEQTTDAAPTTIPDPDSESSSPSDDAHISESEFQIWKHSEHTCKRRGIA